MRSIYRPNVACPCVVNIQKVQSVDDITACQCMVMQISATAAVTITVTVTLKRNAIRDQIQNLISSIVPVA